MLIWVPTHDLCKQNNKKNNFMPKQNKKLELKKKEEK